MRACCNGGGRSDTSPPNSETEVDVIRVSAFFVGASILMVGCGGVPTGPDSVGGLLDVAHAAATVSAASVDPTLLHPVTPTPPPAVLPQPPGAAAAPSPTPAAPPAVP